MIAAGTTQRRRRASLRRTEPMTVSDKDLVPVPGPAALAKDYLLDELRWYDERARRARIRLMCSQIALIVSVTAVPLLLITGTPHTWWSVTASIFSVIAAIILGTQNAFAFGPSFEQYSFIRYEIQSAIVELCLADATRNDEESVNRILNSIHDLKDSLWNLDNIKQTLDNINKSDGKTGAKLRR